MEETIGYEALFSPDEWDSIQFGDWSDPEEVDLEFDDTSPFGDSSEAEHFVRIHCQDRNDRGPLELECERCGDIGTADTDEQAQAIARLHESFVATLVGKWSAER